MTSSSLLPFAISICGLEELTQFAGQRVSHAVSILDPGWPDPQEFAAFIGCHREIFRFHDCIDETLEVVAPRVGDVERLLVLGERLRAPSVRHLLVHCHAGISRSTAAASILLAQFQPAREDDVFHEVARIRPWSWPNSRMIELADDLLGRQGRLVAAMRAHHARMIKDWPELAATLREGARAREYRLAGDPLIAGSH